ncbi:putative uncharacterized protein [Waddlia chondrophila 2032/99]|uniref:Uncharacterized protein n=1 Tax=Waddlia chondrophila 2032/99 TaxID=765953 RepID=F8LEP1_9BACT|nr:putative uncharacterized protein [Waddlia chondrophila 2032/99]
MVNSTDSIKQNYSQIEKQEKSNKDLNKIDKKTYSIARKIFEGTGLILLNILTVFTINFELLRGENSFLKREYGRVFHNKEISEIVSGRKDKPIQEAKNEGTDEKIEAPEGPPISSGENVEPDTISPHNQDLGIVQTNPFIGQPFPLTPNIEQGRPLPEMTFTVLEMNLEIFGMSPEQVLHSPPPLQIEDQANPLSERSLIPTQNSGYLSSLSSILSQGWNYIAGHEEPHLKADATILIVLDRVEHLVKISLDTPLTGDRSPIDMVMSNLHQQLPFELQGAHKRVLQLEGGSSHGRLQLEDTPEDLSEDTEKDLINSTPAITLLASTALFEKALREELHLMASSNPQPSIIPPTSSINSISKAVGISSRLGFNPRMVGIAGVGVLFSVFALLHTNHSYQRRTASQDHTIAKVNPTKKTQGWRGYLYDVFKNIISSANSFLGQQIGTARPIATKEFTTGSTRLRFAYMGTPMMNPLMFQPYGIFPPRIVEEE